MSRGGASQAPSYICSIRRMRRMFAPSRRPLRFGPRSGHAFARTFVDEQPSILLVDDDEVFRERLARALRERAWEGRAAGDYTSAMEAAHIESPQHALVDLRMPGRSGLELVRDLKACDATTKVVVLTGYGSIATAVAAVRLGASH